MIRKIVFLVIALLAEVDSAWPQNLSVSSVKMIPTDSTSLTTTRYDLNGNACAVVMVFPRNITDLLDFKGDIVGGVKSDGAKYTIYIPNRTKRLKIYHPNYIPETIDFTQYKDSRKGLEGNRLYHVTISGNDTLNPVKTSDLSGSRILSFSSNVPLLQLLVNGAEWKIINNTSKRLMPYGEYEYEAVTEGNIRKKGIIELKPSVGSMIVKIDFD